MAQTPTVYRWDDPGAPQVVNGNYSELVNIIDKCLVTGYGSKQPLGWIKGLDEPFTCSYKNRGTGHSVVFSSTTGDNDNTGVRVQSAHNIIDADNLEKTGWKQAFKVFEDRNTSWVIVGTDKAFYCFFCYAGSYSMPSTNHQSGFFVGDLSNAITGDSANFVAICSFISENSSLETTTHNSAYGTNIMFLNYAEQAEFDGAKIYDVDGGVEFSLYVPHELAFRTEKPIPTKNTIPSNTLTKVYLFHKEYFSGVDRDGNPIVESTISPAVRGSLPGLNSTLVGHPENMVWPATVNYGDNYLLLKTVNGDANRLILNIEVWDD